MPGREFTLECEQTIEQPLERVFEFFADPKNLEALTPPWLNFHILRCSTPAIGEGTRIDYKLRLRGIPLRWQSLIRSWNPPHGFVDEQLRGPYRSWIHQHTFEDLGGKTRIRDHVRYSVLGGALVNRLFVRPDVERIFAYRQRRLYELFPDPAESATAASSSRISST